MVILVVVTGLVRATAGPGAQVSPSGSSSPAPPAAGASAEDTFADVATLMEPYQGVWDVRDEPASGSSLGFSDVRLTVTLESDGSVVGRADYSDVCSNALGRYNFEGRSLWLDETGTHDCPAHGALHFLPTDDPRLLTLQAGVLATVARRVGP